MVAVQPLQKRKLVHKRKAKFHRWQAHQFARVPDTWRAPRGIDGRFRRCFKGTGPHAGIGYGTNKKTRFVLPNGFKKFRVCNVEDIEMLLMQNRKYCAEIAATVSVKKRKEILQRAEQLNVRVVNAGAKLQEEENE